MTGDPWVGYDHSPVQFVPCLRRRDATTVGVILDAPATAFLAARFLEDLSQLTSRAHAVDLGRLRRYLDAMQGLAAGTGGPLEDRTPSQRFHWLTAPRSDVLQPTRPHPGARATRRRRSMACSRHWCSTAERDRSGGWRTYAWPHDT